MVGETVSNPDQGPKNPDWSMDTRHKVLISYASKEEIKAVYASWADTFDEDITKFNYSSPEIMCTKLFSLTDSSAVSVLDVACGSGLVAPPFVRTAASKGVDLRLDGIDYSEALLDVASKKDWYTALYNADLNDPLPIADETYDFIISGGLFFAGHCGPEVLPNIAKCLKIGGFALFTVRKMTYENERADYISEYKRSGCEVIEETISHYLGPGDAYYVTLKRVR